MNRVRCLGQALDYWRLLAAVVVLGCLQGMEGRAGEFHGLDSAKVQGVQNCAECHASMVDAWKQTAHYTTFFRMHRRRGAERIASRLGVERIKHQSLCQNCHYVSQSVGGEVSVRSGVSCESCHGAGTDWNKAHSDLQDPDHLRAARAKGMVGTASLYESMSVCYGCHTVPEEELVNLGGHRAGSDFELVAWLEGEVRHHLVGSNGRENEEAPLLKRRVLYVLGRGLDLEYGLRGLVKATRAGEYASQMRARIGNARAKLEEISRVVPLEPVEEMLKAVGQTDLESCPREHLPALVQTVAALNREIIVHTDGVDLSGLDPFLPRPEEYIGTVYQPPEPGSARR